MAILTIWNGCVMEAHFRQEHTCEAAASHKQTEKRKEDTKSKEIR
jgi:hypothetical protein